MREQTIESHTLSSYPDSLQKKVTLLKHFRGHLIEQQKRAEKEEEGVMKKHEEESPGNSDTTEDANPLDLIYLKKWVRSKHAILFRLSDQTIQVVFYDHTEIFLTSEAKFVTYLDKKNRRTTFHLDNLMKEDRPDVHKRLKYAKDMLQQLISGTRH